MSTYQKRQSLPVINEGDFPTFPQTFVGKSFALFNTKWQNAEIEWTVGLILKALVQKGQWEPIHLSTLKGLLKNEVDLEPLLQVIADSGDIDLVEVAGIRYVLPTPVLVVSTNACIMRLYDDETVHETRESTSEVQNIVSRFLHWLKQRSTSIQ